MSALCATLVSMTEQEARELVLRVFAEHRDVPDQWFEEERFLDFLTDGGRSLERLRSSFSGLRKVNRFYDSLQLEAGVCFAAGAEDKNWSAHKLAQHLVEKKQNPAAQKTLVRKRYERARRDLWFAPFGFALFPVGPLVVVLSAALGGFGLAWVALVFGAAALAGVFELCRRRAGFYRRLKERIEA